MNQPSDNSTPDPNDWMKISLTVRGDLKLTRRRMKEKTVTLVEDPVNGKFFQIGTREFALLSSLNGTITIEEANQQVLDDRLLSDEKLKEFFDWLVRNNLVESGAAAHVSRFEETSRKKRQQKLTQFFNPFYFRVPLFHPDAALQRMLPATGWLFSRMGLGLWLVLMLIAGWQLFNHLDQFQQASRGIFSNWQWLWLILAGLLLKVIHECGHGLACRKFGAEVRDTGMVLMCFMPLAYIDVTASWRLPSKWQRISISLGGMFVETMVASLAVIVWSLSPESSVGNFCYQLALMAGFTTLLFNANPLMRFDGYYALSDLLDAPNLYTRAGKQLNRFVSALFMGAETENKFIGTSHLTLLLYGVMTLWWRIMICVGLALVASFMFHGAGIVFAAVGMFFWVALPLKRNFIAARREIGRRGLKIKRTVLIATGCVGFVVATVLMLSRPAVIMAPGIVEFSPLTIIRAEGPGFLREICVESGEFVRAGDRIAILENPELTVRLRRLQIELAQTKIRMRDHKRKGEHSLSQSEEKTMETLHDQIGELQHMLGNLTATAPLDGFVIRRNLADLQGVYFEEGAEIVVLGHESMKELRLSIDQADVDGLRDATRLRDSQSTIPEQSGMALASGVAPFPVCLRQIDPRGSLVPIHASLCVNNGGSLPVQPRPVNENDTGEQDVELLSPGFTTTIPLSSEVSTKLRSGQRVEIRVRSRSKTLAIQTYEMLRDWWRTQIENAS